MVGAILSVVLSPLLYAFTLTLLNTIHLFAPIPQMMEALQGAGNAAFSVLDYLAGESESQIPQSGLFFGVAAWFLPGMTTVVVLWLGIYSLFKHAGVGSILFSLGARPPRIDDLEEQQLCNLVEEMALAAGIPPPRVALLDAAIINAAAVGSSLEDATVIVSRSLLDGLDRDETQSLMGHLIGSIGNGDLRIAFLMTSALLTFGSLIAILKAPFGPYGRTAFLRLLRLGFRGWKREMDGKAESELLKTLISDGLTLEGPDDLDALSQRRFYVLLAPFVFANIAVRWTLYILTPGLLNPLLALLWRTRRHLADATAVQLTRNPNGLAHALVRISRQEGVLPGSQGVIHLFITGPEGANSFADFLRLETISFHPSLTRRLQRLRMLGAHIEETETQRPALYSQQPVLKFVLMTALGLLTTIMAAACLAALALFVLISLFFAGLLLVAIHTVFAALTAFKGWTLG